MSRWHRHNRRLFRKERRALADACPLMMLSVVGPGFPINPVLMTGVECVIAHGTYVLKAPTGHDDVEYSFTLWLPGNYPKSPPIMFCNDAKLPLSVLDRHILSDGQACLELRPEIRRRWPPGSNLVDFLVNLVEPFLSWQTYYDAFGEPPEWGERAHGKESILDYYTKLLGIAKNENLPGFMKLLTRKNRPKGHELCPCNSGLKIRHCHRDSIYNAHQQLFREDIIDDYKTIEKNT